MTDTIRISLLAWKDVIDRTALGFDQLKPPGLAEVAALGSAGKPIAAADAAANRNRRVDLPCAGRAGDQDRRAVRYEPRCRRPSAICSTAARSLRRPATAPRSTLPAGPRELLIQSRQAFIADGAQLAGAAGPGSHHGADDRRGRDHMGARPSARSRCPVRR